MELRKKKDYGERADVVTVQESRHTAGGTE